MTPLTNLMKQTPFSETNIFVPTQGNIHILWTQHVHDRVHNIQAFVLTLSWMNPLHTISRYFLNIRFNNIFRLHLGPPSCHFFLRAIPPKR